MEAQQDSVVVLVDGLISTKLQTEAYSYPTGPKAYFSQRCHDQQLKCRRIIFLDAKSTRVMSSKATGEGVLHFHGMFLLGRNQSEKWLRQRLTAVFGHAIHARTFQFKLTTSDNKKSHGYAGMICTGATGKLAYMLSHVGTTYASLGLNDDGKRSRRAPSARGRVNRKATGFAPGIPSNFVSKAVIWDTETRKIARQAFDAWYSANAIEGQEKKAESAPLSRTVMRIA